MQAFVRDSAQDTLSDRGRLVWVDEYRGGGTHPYYVGNNSLQPNNNFAGYPPYSLIGETMFVSSLMYRAPIARAINEKIGPFYFYDIYGMIGGSAGNFWSFRPPAADDVLHTHVRHRAAAGCTAPDDAAA